MDNKYWYPSQDNAKYNIKKMEEFFNIINSFQNKSYEERVELMKKTWSQDILLQIPITIKYGDLCSKKIISTNFKQIVKK